MKDREGEMRYRRPNILNDLTLPATPKLVAALNALDELDQRARTESSRGPIGFATVCPSRGAPATCGDEFCLLLVWK